MEDDAIFRALADPTRRLLLDELFERDGRTLGELVAGLEMTRFGVMKHLRVLEEAGLLATRKVGREKLHYLNPVPIQLLADRWIGKYAQRVEALVDLKAALEGDETMTSETSARPRAVYEVFIKASQERVWQAITTPEFTRRFFFGGALQTNLQPGTPFVYMAPDGKAPLVDGEVIESDPPRRLVHTWRALWDEDVAQDAASRLTWELRSLGEMTRLTVVHDGFDAETATYKQVTSAPLYDASGGWMWVLSNLKTLLETGETLPPPSA